VFSAQTCSTAITESLDEQPLTMGVDCRESEVYTALPETLCSSSTVLTCSLCQWAGRKHYSNDATL